MFAKHCTNSSSIAQGARCDKDQNDERNLFSFLKKSNTMLTNSMKNWRPTRQNLSKKKNGYHAVNSFAESTMQINGRCSIPARYPGPIVPPASLLARESKRTFFVRLLLYTAVIDINASSYIAPPLLLPLSTLESQDNDMQIDHVQTYVIAIDIASSLHFSYMYQKVETRLFDFPNPRHIQQLEL